MKEDDQTGTHVLGMSWALWNLVPERFICRLAVMAIGPRALRAIVFLALNLMVGKGAHVDDLRFMQRAISLAWNGRGFVDPNPLVGAVIVHHGRIIGEGWHHAYGAPHAEAEALSDAISRGEDLRGATLYVTLEPCHHQGRQPPCTKALSSTGITRIVIGLKDPNPHVAGGGAQWLQQQGIRVDYVDQTHNRELLRELRRQNEVFLYQCSEPNQPFVAAKFACSLDGKIATSRGESQWITGDDARHHGHLLRATYQAIAVGVGTVLADNPHLSARPSPESQDQTHQPVRVVCDTHLRTPLDSYLVQSAHQQATVIATASHDQRRQQNYLDRGCGIIQLPAPTDQSLSTPRLNVASVFHALYQRGIKSVLIEGGATLLGSAFDTGLVNRVWAYLAPRVIGGTQAPSAVGGQGHAQLSLAKRLDDVTYQALGEDLLVSGLIPSPPHKDPFQPSYSHSDK